MRKQYNKGKSKLRSSKNSEISTKESEEIAGEQSTIAFMRWLDRYIVDRISKKDFEWEDDQDVQRNMENERDFPEQDGLQENEEDELSQDNLRDGFGEENTSLLKGTKISPRGSKKRKEMSFEGRGARNWISKSCQNVLPESQISSGFSSNSKAGYCNNLLLGKN